MKKTDIHDATHIVTRGGTVKKISHVEPRHNKTVTTDGATYYGTRVRKFLKEDRASD